MDGDFFQFERRVAVFSGGNSAERAVSLASGQQAALALALAGHQPVHIDPAEIEVSAVDWSLLDLCFIALHGGAGEDGRIQAELDRLQVPYTGSAPAACRLAMSKSAARRRFFECGVPTLPWARFAAAVPGDFAELGFPLVIKPDAQGSSLGVQVAATAAELPPCIFAAQKFGSDLIAEPYVAGREFTVSVLGRDPLPLLEILAPQGVFSYDAKYSNPTTQYRFDHALPAPVEAQLYRAALAATQALDTAGLARVDLILDANHQPWVLEVNTIPGLTARSLAPRAAQAAGISLPALVDWMLRDALDRQQRFRPGVRLPELALEPRLDRFSDIACGENA